MSLFQYDSTTDRRSYLLEHPEEAARYLAARAQNVEGDVRVKDLAGLWHCAEAEVLRSLRGFREAGLMEVTKLNQYRAAVAFPPAVRFSFNKSDKQSADSRDNSADSAHRSGTQGGTQGGHSRGTRDEYQSIKGFAAAVNAAVSAALSAAVSAAKYRL